MIVEYAAGKHFKMWGSRPNRFYDYQKFFDGMSTMIEKTQEEVEFMVSNRKRLLTSHFQIVYPIMISPVLYANLLKQPFK